MEKTFTDLLLIDPIQKALQKEGYKYPTPIQAKTIPLLLDKKDVIGIAQTGTGKTAAFALPVLQILKEQSSKERELRALILAPTRELAAQISDSFRDYGTYLNLKHTTVFGGMNIGPQIKALSRGVDILIATPGRLLDLMQQKKVNLSNIQFLVLDEADRMLDMGFLPDVNKIVSSLPTDRQSLFFSATMSKDIKELTAKFLKNPEHVEITPQSTTVKKIEQKMFFIDTENKQEFLLDLFNQERMGKVLIFVNAKHKANKIARMLKENQIFADCIHGNKTQKQRTFALHNFKRGKTQVLVATDIAARGIDVNDITHVINYDLPNEPENYVHRIGRSGRAGKSGIAYSFCASEDRNFLNEIEKITKLQIPHIEHKFHSERAKNATGTAAKPKPRGGGRGQQRQQRQGGFNRDRNNFRNKENGRNRDRGKSTYGKNDRRKRDNKRNDKEIGKRNLNSVKAKLKFKKPKTPSGEKRRFVKKRRNPQMFNH